MKVNTLALKTAKAIPINEQGDKMEPENREQDLSCAFPQHTTRKFICPPKLTHKIATYAELNQLLHFAGIFPRGGEQKTVDRIFKQTTRTLLHLEEFLLLAR